MGARFTDELLALDKTAFEAATQHPWLRLIGQGKLPADAQLAWLEQDRLYALSYVSFIGGLLGKVSIPTVSDRESTLEWRIADTLINALIGIKRELAMFEEILRDNYGWGRDNAALQVEEPTKRYQQLFAHASGHGCPLMVGLTVLWATEKCYLEAWKFARQQQPDKAAQNRDKDVIRRVLIPNWTSEEFQGFVDTLRDLVDEYATGPEATTDKTTEIESLWRRLLDIERAFWPDVNES
ncbi:heme oxygenase-like protein [Myriangium duriaei CBS 260.36]|uniref:Heme oxygenase-like protein n=1 Tax=Myriangium duriaei CBS 260.36 TaxID=1168546 RepID=A0A9P4J9C3_9PEZI|nr:heme oxygenase-like protein [Myriangium duriaei CBS 260.36]